jgi:hypothetical protein
MSARIVVPARKWTGSRSYVQGLLIHKPSGSRIVHQHGPVFRCHKADGTYMSTASLNLNSHGSSIGLESTGPDTMKLWFRNEQADRTGYATYKVGQSGALKFTATGLPVGDVSIDQAADLLCIRSGNRFRGYRLSAVNAGTISALWTSTSPAGAIASRVISSTAACCSSTATSPPSRRQQGARLRLQRQAARRPRHHEDGRRGRRVHREGRHRLSR